MSNAYTFIITQNEYKSIAKNGTCSTHIHKTKKRHSKFFNLSFFTAEQYLKKINEFLIIDLHNFKLLTKIHINSNENERKNNNRI